MTAQQQDKERLMMLLAQEQQNMQRILTAGPSSRPGFWQRVGEWFSKATQAPPDSPI